MTTPTATTHAGLAGEMAGHLATALGAMLGEPVSAEPADTAVAADGLITLSLSGTLEGTHAAALDADGANALARAVLAQEEPADREAVADTLREVAAQAGGLLTQGEAAAGTRVRVQVEEAPAAGVPTGAPAVFVLRAGEALSAHVAWWSDAAPRRPAVAAPPEPGDRVPNVEMILDIDLPLTVRFGTAELPLSALTRLGPGSVIDLGRSPDDPVDVLVNGKVVARGEVVVVAGNYGVRITEILSAADRIRSLGA